MEIEVLQKVRDFPEYMEKGSQGPAVNIVLVALLVWARMKCFYREAGKVVPDAIYGENGVALMKVFQTYYELEADGGFGPQTRAKFVKVFRINFEIAARTTGGITVFVQPNGDMLAWTYEPDA